MSTPNRKISFYLKPAHSRADRLADEMLDTLPVKARGNTCRAAMLAGMALMRQDPRLPHLIAELFDDNTTIEQIRHLISSVFPDDTTAVVAALRQLTTIAAQPNRSTPEPSPTPGDKEDNAAVARRNAGNLFPA
ncbi:plasmid partitioning/stability family protein [Enterobacter ludwigii]|uniref:plasmid partitioning/stability family protein n=1 Tax=Enterobacter ludwigii TaxID=299767 RepID=UPI00242D3D4C|nr:plasmid partitioning/stability family protein [Enterobacter ludwigii]WGA02975.1 plasmid partitioning/stability family protein [Enterobacter ludwigii]